MKKTLTFGLILATLIGLSACSIPWFGGDDVTGSQDVPHENGPGAPVVKIIE